MGTYALGIESHYILPNRKIGLLGGENLAIRPPDTRPGVEIHAFRLNGQQRPCRLLVLRPYHIESGEYAGYPWSETGWGETRHFTLVGFAYMGGHDEKFGRLIWKKRIHKGGDRYYNLFPPTSTTALIH